MKFAFAVLLSVLAAQVFCAGNINADMQRLEKDLAHIKAPAALKSVDTALNQAMLATKSDPSEGNNYFTPQVTLTREEAARESKDLMIQDWKRFGSKPTLRLSLSGGTDFFKGAIVDGQKTTPILVVISTQKNLMDSYAPEVITARYTEEGKEPMILGTCSVAASRTTLTCSSWTFESISSRGLLLSKHGAEGRREVNKLLLWRYDAVSGGHTDSKLSVAAVSEFLQSFGIESGRQVGNDAGQITGYDLAAVERRYLGARIGLASNLETVRAISTEMPAEELKIVESLINAAADEFNTISKWANTMDRVFDSPEASTPRAFTREQARDIFANEPAFRPFYDSLNTARQQRRSVKLTETSASTLRQGTRAGAKALSDLLKKQIEGQQNRLTPAQRQVDPSLDMSAVLARFQSGEMETYVDNQLFDALAAEPVFAEGLNNAMDFAATAQETLARKGEEIADYFKNLVGLNSKKAAVAAEVNRAAAANGGTLKPGEDGVVKTMFNTAAEASVAQAKAAEEKLKFKSKFRFNPKFGLPRDGDMMTALREISTGYRLSIEKGRNSGFVDLNVRVTDPLDRVKAAAEVTVKVEGTHNGDSGTTVVGVQARANVIGIYNSPQVQGVVVDTYIKYNSRDGRIATGFFTTVDVPLQGGRDLSVSARAELVWKPDPSFTLTAYVGGDTTSRGVWNARAGARADWRINERSSFFIDASANMGGDSFGSRDRGGGQVMVGYSLRF